MRVTKEKVNTIPLYPHHIQIFLLILLSYTTSSSISIQLSRFYLANSSLNKDAFYGHFFWHQEEVTEAKQKSRDRVTAWANVSQHNE